MLLAEHNEFQVIPGGKAETKEVEVYLAALASYAEEGERNPGLTFEEHYRLVAGREPVRIAVLHHQKAAAGI